MAISVSSPNIQKFKRYNLNKFKTNIQTKDIEDLDEFLKYNFSCVDDKIQNLGAFVSSAAKSAQKTELGKILKTAGKNILSFFSRNKIEMKQEEKPKITDQELEKVYQANEIEAANLAKWYLKTYEQREADQEKLLKDYNSFLVRNGYKLRTEFYMFEVTTMDDLKALTPEEYEQRLKSKAMYEPEEYKKINEKVEEYTLKFENLFKEEMGISYEEYQKQIEEVEKDLTVLKSAKYNAEQMVKKSTYLTMMVSEEFLEYKANYKAPEKWSAEGILRRPNVIERAYYYERKMKDSPKGMETLYEHSFSESKIHDYTRYKLLTEEEKMLYNYLFEKEGFKSAERFIEAYEDTLNRREGLKEAVDFINTISNQKISIDYTSPNAEADFIKELEKVEVGDKWHSFFDTTGKGFVDGVENFGEGIVNVFEKEGIITANQYSQMYILSGLSEKKFLSGTYEVSSSAGNMAPTIAIAAVLGPGGAGVSASTAGTIGYTVSGLSIFGNAKNQALVGGNDLVTATMYGTLNGLSELGLGKFLGNIGVLNENARLSIRAIVNEGVEEGLQSFVDAGLRASILEEEIDISVLSKDAAKSFIYGMILSGITTGGQKTYEIVSNKVKYKLSINDITEIYERLNHTKSSNVQNIVNDYVKDLKNVQLEQQKKSILNIDILENILKNPTTLSKEQYFQIKDYILKNDLDLYLKTFGFKTNLDIAKFILSDSSILQQISDRDLVALSNTPSLDVSNAKSEIERRVLNGQVVFDHLAYDFSEFTKKDFGNSTKLLSDDVIKTLNNNMVMLCRSLPSELKSIARKMFIFEQVSLARAYKDKKIDATGIDFLQNVFNQVTTEQRQDYTFVNFNLCNKEYIDVLGTEYLQHILTNPVVSSKIELLHDSYPSLFRYFADYVQLCLKDNSLNTFYSKTKFVLDELFEQKDFINTHLLDESFPEYLMMHSKGFIDSYSKDWKNQFYLNCDLEYKNSMLLDQKKNAFLKKYFSISLDEAHKIVSKYGEDLKSIQEFAELSINMIENIQYILDVQNKELLDNLYQNTDCSFQIEEILYMEDTLREAYAKTYVDKLNTTKEVILESPKEVVSIDGKQVELIHLENDFGLIIRSTSTGYGSSNVSVNSYIQQWDNNIRSHILSASYITQDNIGTAPLLDNGVLYGIDTLDASSIAMISPYDIHSQIYDYGYTSLSEEKFVAEHSMANYTLRTYNEIALEKKNIKPNYIVIFDDSSPAILHNSVEAASEWNIPILKIDRSKILKQQNTNIQNSLTSFVETGKVEFLEKTLNLYEASVSGFQANVVDKQNSVNVFDEKRIVDSIYQVIKSHPDTNIKSDVIKMLENIQYKYDLTKNASSSISKTASKLNINELILILKGENYE